MGTNKLVPAIAVATAAVLVGYFFWQNSFAVIPVASMPHYSSEDGVSFMYPDTYELSMHVEGNGERSWNFLVLLPKGYVPPEAGEGPPSISMGVFPNPEGLSVEQWVKGDGRSNWKLIVDDRASRPMIVGGKAALWYHYSGLYETDSVAVAYGEKIFLFSVGWLDPQDQIRLDFNNLVSGVQFD